MNFSILSAQAWKSIYLTTSSLILITSMVRPLQLFLFLTSSGVDNHIVYPYHPCVWTILIDSMHGIFEGPLQFCAHIMHPCGTPSWPFWFLLTVLPPVTPFLLIFWGVFPFSLLLTLPPMEIYGIIEYGDGFTSLPQIEFSYMTIYPPIIQEININVGPWCLTYSTKVSLMGVLHYLSLWHCV